MKTKLLILSGFLLMGVLNSSAQEHLGLKAEISISKKIGSASKGTNYEFSASVMEGSRMESKNVYGLSS